MTFNTVAFLLALCISVLVFAKRKSIRIPAILSSLYTFLELCIPLSYQYILENPNLIPTLSLYEITQLYHNSLYALRGFVVDAILVYFILILNKCKRKTNANGESNLPT